MTWLYWARFAFLLALLGTVGSLVLLTWRDKA
jgi:hypothetical protein